MQQCRDMQQSPECTHHDKAADMPSSWLIRFAELIPQMLPALDVACGRGRHMRWLSSLGVQSIGVDRNAAALREARQWGAVVQADLEQPHTHWPFAQHRFGAVLVSNYLWRPLFAELFSAVQPGGVLLYETFAHGQQHIGRPARPEFLLQPGELLEQVQLAGYGWRVVAYENGYDPSQARCVQRLAAQRL